jgi:vacuolar iron transporter family protein
MRSSRFFANPMPPPDAVRLLRNWQAECDSAALYEALACGAREAQEALEYAQLAAKEREHARFWETRLAQDGQPVPAFRPSLQTRFLILLARWFGVGFVIPSITVREMADRDQYDGQEDARAAGLAADEHAHAALMRTRTGHAFANNLRAAILGANDGLASNFCLLMGVAGGGARASSLLLTGFAGLMGGAASMALGEWLSVTNARELATSQMDRTVGDTRPAPLDLEQTMSLGNAWSAAALSFGLFAVGAAVPLLSFCVLRPEPAVRASVVLSLAALFGLGLATSLFNGRRPLFSGLRQTAIGAAAAAATYLAGRAFGVLVS